MIGPYYTVGEIIEQSLRKIGAISFGEAPEAGVYQASLMQLNSLLRKWSNNYMNYKSYDYTYTTSANQAVITMGTAFNGKFPTSAYGEISARPATIDQVDIIMGTLTFPVAIKSYSEYTRLPIKNIVSIPQACYYKEGMPFDELWFFPIIPSSYSVRIVGKSYLPHYKFVSEAIVMPPEYVEALVPSLSLLLSSMFGQNPSEGIYQEANSAMKHIKQRNVLNAMPRGLNDFGTGGTRNFWAGC